MKIVAVIDDGLNYNRLELKCPYIEYEIIDGVISRFESFYQNKESHGLICSKIIETHIKGDFLLISIRVKKDEKTDGKISDLIKAISFCINMRVDIISISLGICDSYKRSKLHKVVKQAMNKGIILVAAVSNDNEKTYPALFKEVIAVKANIRGLGERILRVEDSIYGEVYEVWPKNEMQTKDGQLFRFVESNSFACPLIASIIAGFKFECSSCNKKRFEYVVSKLQDTAFVTIKR